MGDTFPQSCYFKVQKKTHITSETKYLFKSLYVKLYIQRWTDVSCYDGFAHGL